jgi:hypothetical protein
MRDPIGRARSLVRAIRASGKRRAAFAQCIADGNEKGWFISGTRTVRVPQVNLLTDVETRWESEIFFLRRIWEPRLVSDRAPPLRFPSHHPHLRLSNTLSPFPLTVTLRSMPSLTRTSLF